MQCDWMELALLKVQDMRGVLLIWVEVKVGEVDGLKYWMKLLTRRTHSVLVVCEAPDETAVTSLSGAFETINTVGLKDNCI